MNRNLCLAACFLPLNDENCRWWLRLQDELAARNLDLVLLTAAPAADQSLRTIVLPFWLQDFASTHGTTGSHVMLELSLADALARRDRAWLGQDSADIARFNTGVIACQAAFRALFEELQPALVLAWGSSLAQSVILQQLALQQGRPCWVLERGLLPGTLMIEMAGQGGQTELNWSFNLQNAWRRSEDTSLFTPAQEICHSRRSTKYAQADYLEPETFHQKFNPERKPLIALLLQHDAASCLVPHDFGGARIHSPVFASGADAVTQLAAAAHEAGCKLAVKPHPNDQTDYSSREDASVSVLRDVNLHSLIGAADVVAAMTSTAQFEALLHEKPILLLARSALADKGVAYEVKSPAQLPEMLRAALNHDHFPQRSVNARRFVSFVLQNFSISLTEGFPTGATLADLAQFLSQNAVATVPDRSLEDRHTAAIHLLEPCSHASSEKAATNGVTAPRAASMPASTTLRVLPGPHKLEVYPVNSRAAFGQLYQTRLGNMLREQQRFAPGVEKPFTLPGYCAVCGCERQFMTDFLYAAPDASGRLQPSWPDVPVRPEQPPAGVLSCFIAGAGIVRRFAGLLHRATRRVVPADPPALPLHTRQRVPGR
jgi:hypothetical protein